MATVTMIEPVALSEIVQSPGKLRIIATGLELDGYEKLPAELRKIADSLTWTPAAVEALEHSLASATEALAQARAEGKAEGMRDGPATHRHKKRGSEYVLIGYGKMQAERWLDDASETNWRASVDMRDVAIYRSATDPTEIWVRPREEFEDGRFEAFPPPPADGETKL